MAGKDKDYDSVMEEIKDLESQLEAELEQLEGQVGFVQLMCCVCDVLLTERW